MPLKVLTKTAATSDVFHSTDVFVNGVAVALWKSPIAGPGVNNKSASTGPTSAALSKPTPKDPDAVVTSDMEEYNENNAAIIASDPANFQTIASGPLVGQIAKITGGSIPPAGFVPVSLPEFSPNLDFGKIATVKSPIKLSADLAHSAMSASMMFLSDEIAKGSWSESLTSTINPNILGVFEEMGYTNIQSEDTAPWSAAFVGSVLKKTGMPYLSNNLSAVAYASEWSKVAISANTADPTTWRANDVIVFDHGDGSGHVGFIKGVDPVGNRVKVLGGNQNNGLCEMIFSADMFSRISYVGRGQAIPSEFDSMPTLD